MDRIQHRRDTRANWEQYNPVLMEGEIGLVMDDPNLYKVGDGTNAWNDLPFRGFDGTIVHELGDSINSVMSQSAITKIINEYNVSKNHPTEGISNGYKYTLESAIEKIPEALRSRGIKCTFINELENTVSYIWQGGTYNDLRRWTKSGIAGEFMITILDGNFSVFDEVKEVGIYYVSLGSYNFYNLLHVYFSGTEKRRMIQEYKGFFNVYNGSIGNGKEYNTAIRSLSMETMEWDSWRSIFNTLNNRDYSLLAIKNEIKIDFSDLLEGSFVGNDGYKHSDFIQIDKNFRIKYSLCVKGDYMIEFYDENKSFISGIRAVGTSILISSDENLIPPSNANYVRFQTAYKSVEEGFDYNYYFELYNAQEDLNNVINNYGGDIYDFPYQLLSKAEIATVNDKYLETPYLRVFPSCEIKYSVRVSGNYLGKWYNEDKEEIGKIKSGLVGSDVSTIEGSVYPPKEAKYFKIITMGTYHPNYEAYTFYLKIKTIGNILNKNIEYVKHTYRDIDNADWENGNMDSNIIETYRRSPLMSIDPDNEYLSLNVRIKGGEYLAFYDYDRNKITSFKSDTGHAENVKGDYYPPQNSSYFRVVTMKENHEEYEYYDFSLKICIKRLKKEDRTFSAIPSLELWAAQEINFNDGSDPISKNYLFSNEGLVFYFAKNKYGDDLSFAFTWDSTLQGLPSSHYSAAVLPNGDVLFIYKSESVTSGETSDAWQLNPILYERNNDYKPTIIDFGNNIKPGGWLQNVGFNAIYPYNECLIFGEYTRATALKARIWKVKYPYKDPTNWTIRKEFDVDYSQVVPDTIKHIHSIQFDQFTGLIYASTGDEHEGSKVFVSKDKGDNWELLYGPSEKYCRLLNYIFTEDYVYWATDSPTNRYHYLFRTQRDENGVIKIGDAEELTQLEQPESGMLLATYGLCYLKLLNVFVLLERVDGGGYSWMPIRMWDISSNKLLNIGEIKSVSGEALNIGFRCQYLELYPKDFSIICGYNDHSSYRNYNKILGNKDSTISSNRINNLLLRLGKNGENYNITWDTIYK